jgi:peptide/nickel transport system substrate-binding protein
MGLTRRFNMRCVTVFFVSMLVLGMGSVMAQEPIKGGILTVSLFPEPPMLVSALHTADPTTLVSPKIHDGLVTYDFDYNWKPSLAESWKISPDGKEITFNLRKGVKWHDGKDFTSEDVAFSIMLMKEHHPRGRATFAEVTSVETPDPHVAILKLKQAAPYMMRLLAPMESPIVPKHIYAGTDPLTNPNNVAPVGTGPFKFVEWVKGSHIILERNPNYWDKSKPYVDRIVWRIIPDHAARSIAIESGEIDVGPMNPVPLSDISRLISMPNLVGDTTENQYTAIFHRLEFNLGNQYLKDKRVRQAIAHAIDKKFILDNIYYGHGTIATGPIHDMLKAFYTPNVPSYEYNPDKANKLLDEAGYKKDAAGIRFKLTHDYLPLGSTFERTADYLKQALKQVGIEVNIRGQDFAAYVRRIYTLRDFDFTNNIMNNQPDPTAGVQRLYWSKNFKPGVPFSNGSGYSNPEMDRLLEAAQTEVNTEKRVNLWHEVQKLVMTDLPDFPLVCMKRVTIYNKRVKNLIVRPMAQFDNFAEVYLEKK